MRTRRSVRNQNILFRELFQPAKLAVEKARPAYLDMSDDQIDETYFFFGKSDRTRMKKEAARERLRSKIANDPAVCAANAEAALGAAAGPNWKGNE